MGKTLYELEQSYKKMGQEYEELGRQIEELKKEKRIAKIGELVTVGGIEWKILDKVDGGYFAIANDKICDMKFDDVSNDWCNSDIRKYLDREIVPKVQCDMNGYSLVDFERDLTSLDGQKEYGKCRDKISLLSLDEYRKYRHLLPNTDDYWWWLLTPWSTKCNDSEYSVEVVSPDGRVNRGSCVNYDVGVRPCCIFPSSIFQSCEE